MNNRFQNSILILALLGTSCINAQQTLDASNLNNYVLGGDQKSTTATINLLEIKLIDIEPDPGNTINFNSDPLDMEAGMPAMGANSSGILNNEKLWMNFAYRALNDAFARIVVYANQAIPKGMVFSVQIVATGAGGDYAQNPNFNQLELTTIPQTIVYDFDSGYTDDGEFKGYQLKYTIENNSGASLPAGFEIIYEIKTNN